MFYQKKNLNHNFDIYFNKYQKYKNKYIKLKYQIGGEDIILILHDKTTNKEYNIEVNEDDDIITITEILKNKIGNLYTDIKFYRSSKSLDNKYTCGQELLNINTTIIKQCNNIICFKTVDPPNFIPIPNMSTGSNTKKYILNTDTNTYTNGLFNIEDGVFIGYIKDGSLDQNNMGKVNEGIGRIIRSSGNIYEGTIKNNQLNGEGRKIDDYLYEGDFINNKLNGKGKITFPDGTTCEGNFRDDDLNGKGIVNYHSGEVNEGYFIDNALHGEGKITFPSSITFQGKFENDKLNGYGYKKFPNGEEHEGFFINDKLNGKGRLKLPDSTNDELHEGDFKDDKLNGEGKITLPDSTNDELKYKIYEGTFVDNDLNGKGKITFHDGTIYEGTFIDNDLYGEGKITFHDGIIYEGQFINNILNEGKITVPDSTNDELKYKIYEGTFVDNYLLNGKGKITFHDGTIYEGQFINNILNGEGKITFPNSEFIKGKFIEGKIIDK